MGESICMHFTGVCIFYIMYGMPEGILRVDAVGLDSHIYLSQEVNMRQNFQPSWWADFDTYVYLVQKVNICNSSQLEIG